MTSWECNLAANVHGYVVTVAVFGVMQSALPRAPAVGVAML